MNSQALFSAIDQIIQVFWSFARSMLQLVAILSAFFAGVKVLMIIFPFLGGWVPAFFIKGAVLEFAATAIACSLASRGA